MSGAVGGNGAASSVFEGIAAPFGAFVGSSGSVRGLFASGAICSTSIACPRSGLLLYGVLFAKTDVARIKGNSSANKRLSFALDIKF